MNVINITHSVIWKNISMKKKKKRRKRRTSKSKIIIPDSDKSDESPHHFKELLIEYF